MSFQPTVPLSGIAGWRFLERTQAKQQAAFEKGPELQRDIAYFTERIGSIESAADLVADRRLLKVALGAFGMESEIDKRAFIRKVLEEDSLSPSSLANRLADKSYRQLATTFGFGDARGPRTGDKGFAARITEAYKTRAFEAAVGNADNNLRLAMNFRREIATLAHHGAEGGSWFSVLGSKPLREVFEKAYNLPAAFGQIDIDQQREVMRDKTGALFGAKTLAVFKDEAAVERVIDRFLARAQIDQGPTASTPGAGALTLLQGMNANGSSGLSNLIASLR